MDNLKANELTFDDETSSVREMETCSLRGKLIPASEGILYRANNNFLFFACMFFYYHHDCKNTELSYFSCFSYNSIDYFVFFFIDI